MKKAAATAIVCLGGAIALGALVGYLYGANEIIRAAAHHYVTEGASTAAGLGMTCFWGLLYLGVVGVPVFYFISFLQDTVIGALEELGY